jgi:TolB-like protein/Tfp pilus assembly protein PilF
MVVAEEVAHGKIGSSNGASPADASGPAAAEEKRRTFLRTRWRTLAFLSLAAFGVLGLFVYGRQTNHQRDRLPPARMKSIAVLPFKAPAGGSPDDEYLAGGLSDSLNTRLGRLKQFVVRPTSSVLKFDGAEQDPRAAGRALEVDGVIDGLVQRDHDRVRLSVRLIRVSDGALIWTDSFDEPFTSLFAIEDLFSHEAVKGLQIHLTTEEQQNFTRRGTANADAFAAYLRGRHSWNKRTAQSVTRALKFFQQAIEVDPTYALAYGGMADCYLALGEYGDAAPNESFPLARGAALRALEIDDSLAEAHASLAQARFLYDWDWAGAEREYRRAIELKPNYATAHHWYGMFLAARGRTKEALEELRRAQDLDPLSLIIRANVGTIRYFARDYGAAIAQERIVLQADPEFVQARRKLAFSLEAAGQEKEAIAEWLKVEQQLGAGEQTLADYREACAASGIRGYWLHAIEIDKKEAGGGAGALSSYDARLGQREQAFLWLDRAVEERAPWLVYAGVTPVYDNLRADPRFAMILKRIGR